MSVVTRNQVIGDNVECDSTAYNANHGVFKGGLTKHEVAEYYNNWALSESGDYDSHLNENRYTGPEETARRVRDYFPENQRSDVRVLDVAAGTGRIGVALYNQGFRHIDALDPSEGMMRKAKAKGVYANHIQDFIGDDHKVPVDDGHYDALACSGGFGEGHIPASAMHEMIRIVRPGGLICLTTREEYMPQHPQYQHMMDQLETDARWKLVAMETIDNYFLNKTGCVYQFVVL